MNRFPVDFFVVSTVEVQLNENKIGSRGEQKI